jgi:hypothetical protein
MDLKNLSLKVWTGFIWLRIGSVVGSYEHGNKDSCSIKVEILTS